MGSVLREMIAKARRAAQHEVCAVVRDTLTNNPVMTVGECAELYGVSREYVRKHVLVPYKLTRRMGQPKRK
jgi:hypothetical protein